MQSFVYLLADIVALNTSLGLTMGLVEQWSCQTSLMHVWGWFFCFFFFFFQHPLLSPVILFVWTIRGTSFGSAYLWFYAFKNLLSAVLGALLHFAVMLAGLS